MLKSFNDVPRGVWAISLASLFVSISISMTFSISPIYITEVLGLSMCSMGCIEGLTEMISQFSKLCSGITGDVSRRQKPTLLLGFFLATISKPFFILAKGAEMIIFSKMLERISNGIMATPRDAYIADNTPDHQRGSGFGLVMAAKTIGLAIGSFGVALLLMGTDNYRMVLWVGFIPCIISIWILWHYMDEKPTNAAALAEHAIASGNRVKLPWRTTLVNITKDLQGLPLRYWVFIIISTVFMCARFSDSFLVIRLKELGAPQWLWASTIGIFNLTSALCCFPIGRLADKMDRSKVLYFAFISLVGANLCLLYAQGIGMALVGIVLWGAQRNTSQMIFSAIIADLAPRRIMGTALGVYYFLTGIVAYIASQYAGMLGDISKEMMFKFGLIVSSIALLLLFLYNTFLYLQPSVAYTRAADLLDGDGSEPATVS